MRSTQAPILQVAAKGAIISPSGKVLILREAKTDKNNVKVGQWGLAGGRLDPGEAFSDGLLREVLEETGLQVQIERPLYVGEWHPIIREVPHQIIGIFMLCRSTSEEVKLSTEHDTHAWIQPIERQDYPMMEPDCFVVDMLYKESM